MIKEYYTSFGDDHRIRLHFNEIAYNADKINTPQEIADICSNVLHLETRTEEYVYCFCLNPPGALLGFFQVGHGTVDTCIINPRDIFLKALYLGSCKLIICHNHPSGELTPSADDIQITERLSAAGELIGMRLVDHLIIGAAGKYYSFLLESPDTLCWSARLRQT